MVDDVVFNKVAIIERCIRRIQEEYQGNFLNLETSREAFDFLQQAGIIDEHLSQKLKAMVGFRDIAVHNYQAVNLGIVQGIIEKNLADLLIFGQLILSIK